MGGNGIRLGDQSPSDGRGGEFPTNSLYAFAWRLPLQPSQPSQVGTAIDTPASTGVRWSLAISVERSGAAPRIVGAFGLCETQAVERDWGPAVFSLTSPPTFYGVTVVQPGNDTNHSALTSRHILLTDVAPSLCPTASYDEPSNVLPYGDCSNSFDIHPCVTDFVVGARLDPPTTVTWLRRVVGPGVNDLIQRTGARGLNGGDMAVGFASVLAGQCRERPFYWIGTTPSPMGGVELPRPALVAAALAEGVSEPASPCGNPRIVGWEVDPIGDRGILWDRCSSGVWCSHLLKDLVVNNESYTRVREAYDINLSGYMAVLVEGDTLTTTSSGTQCSGIYATNVGVITGRSDLSGDFRVNATDLGLLLGGWGTSDPCVADGADVDGIAPIDATDLAILLGDWSSTAIQLSTPCAGTGCPDSRFASAAAEGLAIPSEPDIAVGALGFASLDEFLEWLDSADDSEVFGAALLLQGALTAEGGDQ